MSDTITQECKCCGNEDDCIEGLCQSCSIYNYELQKKVDLLTLGLLQEKTKKKGKVTESIFTSDVLVVPLADIQHIEKNQYGLMIITKHTKWNFEHDTWENAIFLPDRIKAEFTKAWCRYRQELEIDTLKDLTEI